MSDSEQSSCIEELGSDWEIPNAQDVSAYIQQEEESNRRRTELQEAGYLSDTSEVDYHATEGTTTTSTEGLGRGTQTRIQSGILGTLERFRERRALHLRVLGTPIVSAMVSNIRGGQTKLHRESVRFGYGENPFKKVSEICQSLQRKGTPFGIAKHAEPYEHYHIVHFCPWKWYCCRCYCPSGKRTAKVDALSNINEESLSRILQYLCTNGHELQYLYSGTSLTRCIHGIELIFDKPISRMSKFEGPLEASYDPDESASNYSSTSGTLEDRRQHIRPDNSLPKSVRYPKPEEVEAFIMAHPIVPLSSIHLSNIWLSSKFRYCSERDEGVKKAIKYIKSRVKHWTVNDFIVYYESDACSKPMWACVSGDIDLYYFNREESKKHIIQLIQFQHCAFFAADSLSDVEGQTEFWTDIYKICNRTHGKRNCIELIGPPNCGKSWFANWLTEFFINVGHVENFNRYHAFPLQSAFNARILNWGEASAEPSALDTVKLLLGGDPCPANIKYENTQTIEKTPVIITANQQRIPSSPPFQERMIRYTWRTAPHLKELTKKPHPLALIDIFREYDIIE